MLNGKVVIISAPSGAGKSTIVNFLLKVFTNLSFSVSVTTRKIRTDEKEGRDYYFISKEEFKKLILENKLIEWEEVYDGDFKGTLKSEVESIISKKKHIIFDVDVKGGWSLKKYFGKSGLSIFINVSGIDILKKRLINRGTESNEKIEERLLKAKEEFLGALSTSKKNELLEAGVIGRGQNAKFVVELPDVIKEQIIEQGFPITGL